jgi:hypothetical protein
MRDDRESSGRRWQSESAGVTETLLRRNGGVTWGTVRAGAAEFA